MKPYRIANRSVSLFAALVAGMVSGAQPQSTHTIELPRRMNVEHLSGSPVEAGTAIGFASIAGIEPSVSLAVLLALRSSNSVRSIKGSEVLSGEEIVVWNSRSNTVMLETTGGIKEISLETLTATPLISADTHGLAISPSRRRLAFWKSSGKMYTLEVVELASKKIIREWNLQRKYRGFADRFELSFDGEDRILARTYDTESATPLKEFDVTTGGLSQIAPLLRKNGAPSNGFGLKAASAPVRSMYSFCEWKSWATRRM